LRPGQGARRVAASVHDLAAHGQSETGGACFARSRVPARRRISLRAVVEPRGRRGPTGALRRPRLCRYRPGGGRAYSRRDFIDRARPAIQAI